MNTTSPKTHKTPKHTTILRHIIDIALPLLVSFAMVLTVGCGGVDGPRPCVETADCIDQERCTQGICQPLNATPTPKAPQPSAPAAPPATQPGTQPPAPRRAAPTTPTTPTPPTTPPAKRPDVDPNACQEPAPECLRKGVCQGISPRCESGEWRCDYPQTHEANETSCDGIDNDCDGDTDEGCDCQPGTKQPCGLDEGACRPGQQACDSRGKWGVCQGAVGPTKEKCDGKDNDCDGQIDEALVQNCYDGPAGSAGKGICKQGKQRCEAGQWSQCVGQVKPAVETCDGIDNNCDGQIDEALIKSCYNGPNGTSGVGACRPGSQRCLAGTWGACTGQIQPQAEVCDNIDNDCDGSIDEVLQRACYGGPANTKNIGQCKGGMQTCRAGSWGICEGEQRPETETCDGVDNDCDGSVDEALQRACYSGPAGTQNQGLCKGGMQVCRGGAWSRCAGEVTPTAEVCDGVDNDCNGQVDESQNICGARKVCQVGQCQCDQKSGFYPSGNTCVKDGDICPAGLAGRSYCATSQHWVVCDPYGKVGVLHCPSFSGTQCINVAGGAGCRANPSQYLKQSCMSFTTNYGTKRTWHAIMSGLGPNANNAIISFEHCVGGGRLSCGYITTSAGSQAACLCGERKQYCSNLNGTVYDVTFADAYGQCKPFWGNQFGCPAPFSGKNACNKTNVGGFPNYACGY